MSHYDIFYTLLGKHHSLRVMALSKQDAGYQLEYHMNQQGIARWMYRVVSIEPTVFKR